MLRDIPYRVLKQNSRAYSIMLLRDQKALTFSDIAKQCGVTASTASQLYRTIKKKQIDMYANHIAIVKGHGNNSEIRKVVYRAVACYRDMACVSAYLEKKYRSVLAAYRGGEPGMPRKFIKNLPPFRPELTDDEIKSLLHMREEEKLTFKEIGRRLDITQKSARNTYENYYYQKSMELIQILLERNNFGPESIKIMEHYLLGYKKVKERYEALVRDIGQSEKE